MCLAPRGAVSSRIKVLIVDDSPAMRGLLIKILGKDPEIEIVGAAVDPFDAREKIKALNPDVLTLDVEMPRMDGITFLKNLMRLRPMPVVMVSTLTERGADVTIAALESGAVDFFTKPKVDHVERLTEEADVLRAKVKAAARANLARFTSRLTPPPVAPGEKQVSTTPSERLIVLGSSMGGTDAVNEVLRRLPADAPATVLTQHIPEGFTARWAQRMDAVCRVRVVEAQDGAPILTGHAYVAPGGRQFRVVKRGRVFTCQVADEPPVNRHRPSVEVLFDSAREAAGTLAVAAILTGMGADGAHALKRLRDAGVFTIAQDEATSVVWGMPGEAVKLDAACEVLPLERIAERLLRASQVREKAA
ncbi:MAG: protein-glutamate methylesterase/protein-glutamine glutaminase [Myxococcota bacterium]